MTNRWCGGGKGVNSALDNLRLGPCEQALARLLADWIGCAAEERAAIELRVAPRPRFPFLVGHRFSETDRLDRVFANRPTHW